MGTLLSNIAVHLGTAAERAAMSTSGLLLGSRFGESDTGISYIWTGTNILMSDYGTNK